MHTPKIYRTPINSLTVRHKQILQQLFDCKGDLNEVAFELCIGRNTLKTHLNKIFYILQVKDRCGAVVVGIQNGLITTNVKGKTQ